MAPQSRYQAIVISQEEEAQVDRLTCVLSNGVKEGLVARVLDWPGVHATPALLSGLPLEGVWYDRTKEYLSKIKEEEDQLRLLRRARDPHPGASACKALL